MKFTCDTPPETVKWMDWGKDHYATVCFSNTGDRVIAVPWMSNWQYANQVPTQQFRSANGLPRELSLFTEDGEVYMASAPVEELESLRQEGRDWGTFHLSSAPQKVDTLMANNTGAYELDLSFKLGSASIAGFNLVNSQGEKVKIYLDKKNNRVVMDRTESGETAFGEKGTVHAKENHDRRKTLSVNYQNDFALGTWAPLPKGGDTYHLRIYVDKCSVELFLNGGKVAMTNLVFPSEPYNSLELFSEGGNAEVKLTSYPLNV